MLKDCIKICQSDKVYRTEIHATDVGESHHTQEHSAWPKTLLVRLAVKLGIIPEPVDQKESLSNTYRLLRQCKTPLRKK